MPSASLREAKICSLSTMSDVYPWWRCCGDGCVSYCAFGARGVFVHMNTSHSGNRGQRSEQVRHWSEVRPRTLRLFVRELIATHGLRGAEKVAQHSKEGLRQIAAGKVKPNLGTRRKLAQLFLELYPDGTLLYKGRSPRPRLIEVAPAIDADVRTIVALASRFPGEVPQSADALQQWLLEQIEGEHEGDRRIFGDRGRAADDD